MKIELSDEGQLNSRIKNALKEVGPAPCEECDYCDICAVGYACRQFNLYVMGLPFKKNRFRVPRKSEYRRSFPERTIGIHRGRIEHSQNT